MQTITSELQAELESGAQTVVPRVTAEWLNSRFVNDLRAFSTSDNYIQKSMEMNPRWMWTLADPPYVDTIQKEHPLANIWILNDTTSTAVDTNGLNNGTYHGGYTQSQVSRISTFSTLFNGSTGYVSVPSDVRWSPGFMSGYMSLEAWVNLSATGANQTIMGKGSTDASRTIDDGYEWKFRISSANKIEFYLFNPDGSTYLVATGTTTLTTSTWYHIVVTWSGTVAKIYLNGHFEASARLEAFLIDTPIANTTDLNIGRMSDATEYLNGKLNGIVIYNTVISPAEVFRHYSIGIGKTYDLSSYARNGSWVLSSDIQIPKTQVEVTTNRLLPANRYYPVFSGSEYIQSDTDAGAGENMTIEAWIKPSAHPGNTVHKTALAKCAADNKFHFGIDVVGTGASTEKIQVYVSNAAGTTFTVDSTTNTNLTSVWTHVIMTIENDVIKLYINGTQEGTPATITGSRLSAAATFCVARRGASATGQLFVGSVFNIFVTFHVAIQDEEEAKARYYSTQRASTWTDYNFRPTFMTADEVVNGFRGYGHLWGVLGGKDKYGNKQVLSGAFDIAEDSTQNKQYKFEYGWWGNNPSDSSGDYAVPERIVLDFDDLTCNTIGLYMPQEYGKINTYQIYYKDTSGVWNIIGSTWQTGESDFVLHQLSSSTTIKGIAIYILSSQLPSDYARVVELVPLLIEELDGDDIVSLDISKIRENFDSSVPFGATAANGCNIVLQNTELRFNPHNTDSDLAGLLEPDTKFKVELGWGDAGSLGLDCPGDGCALLANRSQLMPANDMDIRVYFAPDDITPSGIETLVGVGSEAGGFGSATWERVDLSIDFNYPVVTEYGSGFLVGGGFTNLTDFYTFDPSTDTFTPVTDSTNKRAGAAATYLGVAYVWQDRNSSNAAAKKVSKFNGSWTALADAPWAMYTAVTVGTKIYVSDYSDIYEYNPVGDTYTLLDDISGSEPFGSLYDTHQFVESGGIIYAVGAYSDFSNEARIYVIPYVIGSGWGTPSAYQVVPGSDTFGSYYDWAVTCSDGKIYVMGGWADFFPIDNTFIYDIAGDSWSDGPTMLGRLGDIRGINNGTSIYIFGGWDEDSSQQGFTDKLTGGSTEFSWRVRLLTDGKLRFSYSLDGSTETDIDSTASLSGVFTTGYIKVTSDVTGGNTAVKFWYSITGDSWTQLGSTVMAGVAVTVFQSAQDMHIGAFDGTGSVEAFDGVIYRVELRDGLDGVVVANPDFRTDPANVSATSFTDSVGNSVNIVDNASLLVGGVEYVDQGTFYADTFNAESSSMSTTISCRDFSKYMQEENKNIAVVLSDVTGAEAVASLAKDAGVEGAHISVNLPYSKTVILDGPVAYWDFSQVEEDNYCFHFDGSSRLTSKRPFYMDRTSIFDTAVIRPYWFETWIKPTAASGTIFNFGTATQVQEFSVKLDTWDIKYVFQGSTTSAAGVNLNDGLWHHLAAKVTTGSVETFLDGVSVGTLSPTTYDLGGKSGYITLGNVMSTYPSTFGSSFFTGYLNDVKLVADVYEDILQKFTVDPLKDGPTSYYGKEYNTLFLFTFAEGSGTEVASSKDAFNKLELNGNEGWTKVGVNTLRDKAGINNATVYDISAFSQSSPVTSEIGHSYEFDGTSHASVLPRPELDFVDAFTLEAWVLTTAETGDYHMIVSKTSEGASESNTYKVGINVDRKICVGLGDAISSSAISLNTWTHIVVTIGSGVAKFYINGVLDATRNISDFTPNGAKLLIGTDDADNSWEGNIANLALSNRPLTSDEVYNHYKSGLIYRPKTYGLLWTTNDQTYWDAILQIALADIGMVFFDELDTFVYETGFDYYNTTNVFPQHTVSQYTLDEDKNIVNGSQDIELLVNKIIVKVNPVQSTSNSTTEIWAANGGESLAGTTLSLGLALSDDTISFATTVSEAGTLEPVFPRTGLVRIGDELIRYTDADDTHLYGLTRGEFGTFVGTYTSGEFVGEAREYNLEWSSTPVLHVKYPFLTAVIFDGTVDINLWTSSPTSGHLVISLTAAFDPTNVYQVLQGSNPVSGLDNAFAIAGVPAQDTNATGTVSEVSSEYKNNIRRHRVKDVTIDNPFIQDSAYAKQIADFVLAHYTDPTKILNIDTIGLPHLQLGDRITINPFAQLSIANRGYWIMSIEIQYDGGVSQTMTLKEVD